MTPGSRATPAAGGAQGFTLTPFETPVRQEAHVAEGGARNGVSTRSNSWDHPSPLARASSAPENASKTHRGWTQRLSELRAARAGDRCASDRLLEGLCPFVEGCLRRRLSGGWTESWIPDLRQDVLLRILTRLESCRAESEAAFQVWVRRIVERRVAELFRREGRMKGIGAQVDLLAAEASPLSLSAEQVALVKEVVGGLSDAEHELLWHRLVAGETWREIASVLDTSPATAKRRFQRVRAKWRKRAGKALSETFSGKT